jgi:hypothetical protein
MRHHSFGSLQPPVAAVVGLPWLALEVGTEMLTGRAGGSCTPVCRL